MANEKDLYGILGVKKSASDDEVRSAYRKLARKFHPDVNQGDKSAEERFKELSAAYEVLSDSAKRKLYDEFGAVGLRDGFDVQKARAYERWSQAQSGAAGWPTGGAGGMGGMGASGPGAGGMPGGMPGGAQFDLSDIFGDWFGGGGKRQAQTSFGRGRDLSATVDIELSQALSGCEISLQMPAAAACGRCGGTGKPAGQATASCGACNGRGRSQKSEVLTVRIPRGADQGSKLRVSGRGEPGSAGAAPGDLLIETRIKPHPHFSREGLNLTLKLPVSLDEAYSGAQVQVPTPGGMVSLRIPPLSQHGTLLRLKGKGVERSSKAGDLFVQLQVRLPDKADKQVAEALRQTHVGYEKPVRSPITL
jgi:molecular chaperone DnaJ